jgi:pyruvate dehydrogenase E1 component alpha subunit
VLVVVEHNGIAQSTPTARQMAGTIAGRAAAFGIEHRRFEGDDVPALRAAAGPLVAAVRAHPAPLVLEFATVRLGPHSKGDDTRSEQELRELRQLDWAVRYARHHPDQFAEADAAARARVATVVADVLARPSSTWSPPHAA